MRKWQIRATDPGSFILAADARWGNTAYPNDQIWEFKLTGGEPSAVTVQTTFGLRAKDFRIFPRFTEGDTAIVSPEDFATPVQITQFCPNYLSARFSPFDAIQVDVEYWAVSSQIFAGRLTLQNTSTAERDIRPEMIALLNPTEGGERMIAQNLESTTVLTGKTSALAPVFFMTGGPEISAGPYPALALELKLEPGQTRRFTWAQAALETPAESFEIARKTAARNWSHEIAPYDVASQSQIEIQTGDSDWDIAFALSQKTAFNLLMGPTEECKRLSFVQCRQPDQGFSALGNGSDYGHLWNGQTPLETYYLCTFLLPNAPEIAQGLLQNFLETQNSLGFVDWKPGLAGQRGKLMATPILVQLAWEIYAVTQDRSFLERVFPGLLRFIQHWFSTSQDQDGDGLPEWTRSSHSGFEDHPVFSQWQPWAHGADISKTESVSLSAFLFQEINRLIQIAKIIEQTSPVSALEAVADNLISAVATAWDYDAAIYRNWDRETHFSPNGEFLAAQFGSGDIQLNKEFEKPARILIEINAKNEVPREAAIFIHGVGASGNHRVERVAFEQFRWLLNRGNATSEQVYQAIEFLEITGLQENDHLALQVVDLSTQDQTQLLPLWAGIPSEDQAFEIIKKTLTNPDRFWKSFGMTACAEQSAEALHPSTRIDLIWNHLLGEGMLAYDYREEAALLVTNLMKGVVKNLKEENAFFQHYNANTGRGMGEKNCVQGLAPLRLFLDTLGVQIYSAEKVRLSGKNPFPWHVTLKYQGLKIERQQHHTRITFPGGQTVKVDHPNPCIITLNKQTL